MIRKGHTPKSALRIFTRGDGREAFVEPVSVPLKSPMRELTPQPRIPLQKKLAPGIPPDE
jgi:hypothetical protein